MDPIAEALRDTIVPRARMVHRPVHETSAHCGLCFSRILFNEVLRISYCPVHGTGFPLPLEFLRRTP